MLFGTLNGFTKTIYQTPITAALLTGTSGEILDLSSASGVPFMNPTLVLPVPVPMPILPAIGILGNTDSYQQRDKKKKSDTSEPKGTASKIVPEVAGIPVESR